VILYLAGVVYVASKAGRAPAIATVLGGILLYDLMFVPPRWSLKPAEPQYWLAFAVMMVVGLIISQLAAQTREQAMLAEARAQRTQTLNQLSVALGRARDEAAISSALRDAVLASTGATSWLMRLPPGRDSLDGDADAPEAFSAHWAGEALARGSEVGAGMAHGSDQALRYLPLIAGDAAFGVLVASPPAPGKDSLEDQHLLRALANQAAIALERAALERRSMAVAVEAEGERTRNTLLAGISHDFRTPLTTIVGSATLLVEQADAIGPSQRTSLLRTLLSEAQRLHTLTSNLLDLTRLDAGAVKPRPEWCPPDELIQSARSQLGGVLRDHSVTVDLPADAVVWCDATLIEQVLVNLLANATRHSPPGSAIGVKVVVSTGHWTLSVHDNGPGIAPGQEQAIFQKFHRAPGDGDSTGKGLGLAICAAVADLHGGRIVAENDAGARFTMVLPQPTPPDIAQDALT
jgi:two-component system, OmpR family, sensor histidine kinase KdpD